jgi:hypothetical protein
MAQSRSGMISVGHRLGARTLWLTPYVRHSGTNAHLEPSGRGVIFTAIPLTIREHMASVVGLTAGYIQRLREPPTTES